MPDVAGFPYIEAQFTVDGTLNPAGQAAAILAFLRTAPAPTDLLVLSHGWNNDIDDARLLYRTLLGSMRGLLDSPTRGDGLAVLAVLWPSKKFAEASLIPGGGVASAGNADTSALAAKLERLKDGPPAAAGGADRRGQGCVGGPAEPARRPRAVRRPPAPGARARTRRASLMLPSSSSVRTRRSCSPAWTCRFCCWHRLAIRAGAPVASVVAAIWANLVAKPPVWPISRPGSSLPPIGS